MRDLTKAEKKKFDIFIKGYVEGLKAVSPIAKMTYSNPDAKKKLDDISPNDDEAMDAFKKNVFVLKRNKENYKTFHDGFVAGYFRSLSSELPRPFLDPELNEDIMEYLKNTWLHDQVYGKGANET